VTGTILVAATGLGLIAVFWLFQPFQNVQASLSDILFQKGPGSSNVVIAQIDDKTIQEYQTQLTNSPRTLHAKAITNLKAAGARLIVFDILIADPSPEDATLADAIKQAGNVILEVAGTQPSGAAGDNRFLAILGPPEALRTAAFDLGHVNIAADADGVLRRLPVYISDTQGNTYPSIVLSALYAQTLRKAPRDLKVENGEMTVLNQKVPVDGNTQFRPLFKAATTDFTRISYGDVLAGKVPEKSLQGKTVIVGGTQTASGDTYPTPIGRIDGVAVLGNALGSLEDGVFVRQASKDIAALALLPLVAVMMYAVPRFNVRVTALLLVLIAVATYIVSIALFNSDQKVIMNFVYPAILLPAMYFVGIGHRLSAERTDRRELSDLFGRYASPEVMQQLTESADRGELNLGGTLREVTVLFADLRGFTGVSERLPPAEVVQFLNKAFDIMIRSIVRNDGIVNKFGGDMVMGIWNAPNDVDDHAIKACRAAVEALAGMTEADLSIPDDPDAKFGFGINTGEVVAGNVGSAGRLEYSVIGDPVNVGSRLCGIAGGGEIYIGERTKEMAGARAVVEDLGPKTLKGRSRPVGSYKVLSVDGVSAIPESAPVLAAR
jgi:adenylate cyclase